MLVHPKRRERIKVQVPLTSLIDIVFLLLIYFLLTTNFMVEEGIKIKLPQARAAAPQTEEVITVYVDQQGRAFLGTQEVSISRLLSIISIVFIAESGHTLPQAAFLPEIPCTQHNLHP